MRGRRARRTFKGDLNFSAALAIEVVRLTRWAREKALGGSASVVGLEGGGSLLCSWDLARDVALCNRPSHPAAAREPVPESLKQQTGGGDVVR